MAPSCPRSDFQEEKANFVHLITMGIKKYVEDFIKKTSSLRVALIGETILDEFVYVTYEGHSMKSACPVYKLADRKKEVQLGGTAAIAGHLKDFVKKVDLFTNTKGEIQKTRYIDNFDSKKHVEVNKFDTKKFPALKIDTKKYDLVIVADFGHGYCDGLDINDGFHLMCQTNSNNFGFNRMSKWKKHHKRSVCLDLREASLQMNKNISSNDKDILELYRYEMNADLVYVTQGGKGSVMTNGKTVIKHKAYPSNIVDTIGAGDTYFTFACLLSAIEKRPDSLAIPSLAASLSTTWLCNEKSVTKKTLLDYAVRSI